jgi:hypothetical protein
LLFYLTPIVYPTSQVPAEYTWLFFANPFASLIICWQGLFFYGSVDLLYVGVALSWACGLLALGLLVALITACNMIQYLQGWFALLAVTSYAVALACLVLGGRALHRSLEVRA